MLNKTLEKILFGKGFKVAWEFGSSTTYEKSWQAKRGWITNTEGIRIALSMNKKEIIYTQFDHNGGFNRKNFSTFKELKRWI